MDNIQKALKKRFEQYRLIFWYDEKQEFNTEYHSIEMEGVRKIEVSSNEFQVKYQVVYQHPKEKFLLYFNHSKPENIDNWLLDLELAHHVFHTNQEAVFLQEMGLGYHLKEFVATHLVFFKSKDRRNKLTELLGKGDLEHELKYKMLAVLFNSEQINLGTYIHAHASLFIAEKEQPEKDLIRFQLHEFYWNEISKKYDYQDDSPSIYGFLLEAFKTNFIALSGSPLSRDSKLLLSLWKDTLRYRESYAPISDRIAVDLGIENQIGDCSLDDIIHDEIFKLSDYKIIHELVQLIREEAISNDKALQYIKKRKNKYWYTELQYLYQSLENASELIYQVRNNASVQYQTFEEGTAHYASTLFVIDQLYRKFIWNYRKTNHNKILAFLYEKIEKVYTNDWLLIYNNNWQKIIDNLDKWPTIDPHSQQLFFDLHIQPRLAKKQRLFVIISDALRYECGEELHKRLLSEGKYDSVNDYLVSSLPSYTQLGMASLLPNKEITIQPNSDNISINGISSIGIQGRARILDKYSGLRATAIKAEDFMKMHSTKEGRTFVKEYDLVYIYHNRIDKTGDDTASEVKVFEAVEEELDYLMEIMRHISNMNRTKMIVTADHGFLYHYEKPDENDYSEPIIEGDIWKKNRRYVVGTGLSENQAYKKFKGKDLNIQSDADFLIPKSINRLRVKASGSRFVHGGASMQEIMIPMISITKKRKNSTSQVEVDIIKSSDKITNNILPISFIQAELVTETILPREIMAAIYAEDGEILSNRFKYNFDISEGSERQREVKFSFQLSSKASGKYKNQRVKLLLKEPVEGAGNKWKPYKEYSYLLSITFTRDFDF